jgi:hypothetical protein
MSKETGGPLLAEELEILLTATDQERVTILNHESNRLGAIIAVLIARGQQKGKDKFYAKEFSEMLQILIYKHAMKWLDHVREAPADETCDPAYNAFVEAGREIERSKK